MNHLEIEYKTLLTKNEYQQLLPLFSDITATKQTNYYIDTADFSIRDAKMALRVRAFENRAELTLKIPQQVGNMEYNQSLTLEECHTLINTCVLPEGEIRILLTHAAINLDELKVLGSLTTIRYEKETTIGLMALDENHYFDKTDYELELEATDAEMGKEQFDYFLQAHHIHYKYAKPKVARFAQNL
ncbi:CYTH domain-containing protein [Streptococcus sp. IsoGale021]|uniref:CYTH domain-containing protein n=1 Tax=Streptococcus TaxID=1301 RepID=UPI0020008FC6|nr:MULTISPECIES: CYTH domain-containing protein [Streptococcus]MCY7210645.1 CYTH domain-containing protein [Streptococcus anginosus]MCY7211630.1 CYTH domain-containing protein [Streptococcus anginosus]MCY7226992.1 CYTH domain-containing protein [Streptococcus anginosus]MDQ8694737.1 CYTH domain-containing protein [Streptococcus sp. IsoGale021]MDU5128414.1 CYTH domain-containing protein [Streptococcus anginosus]